ncbi:MAG: penicillin-binding protein 2, partial [Acidimicrobiales bacterium]
MRDINFRVRMVGAGAAVLVLVVFVQLNYLEVFHASSLDDNRLNTSGLLAQFQQLRGAIVSADGATLAQSVPSNDQYRYQREYPEGALFGQITGYFSFIYGTDGLEREYNSLLTQT